MNTQPNLSFRGVTGDYYGVVAGFFIVLMFSLILILFWGIPLLGDLLSTIPQTQG